MDLLGEGPEQPGTTQSPQPTQAPPPGNPDPAPESPTRAPEPAPEATPPNPDPPAETQEDPPPPEEEPEPLPAAAEEGLSPEAQRALDKRIGKEVARRKAAEDRAAAAEEQLAELQGRPEQAPETPPAPRQEAQNGEASTLEDQWLNQNDPAAKQLFTEMDQTRAIRENARGFLRQMADSTEDAQGGNGFDRVVATLQERKIQLRDWSESGVRAWLEDQRDEATNRHTAISARLEARRGIASQRLQEQRAAWDRDASTAYPWMSDANLKAPTTEEGRLAAQWWKNPVWRQLPYGKMMLGDMIAGMTARAQRPAAGAGQRPPLAAPVAQPRRPAPRVGGVPASSPGTAPASESGSGARANAAFKKAVATGDEGAIEDYLVNSM